MQVFSIINLGESSRGFKRDYSYNEAAVAKMKRLMEKHLDDPNEYGLYRKMTATARSTPLEVNSESPIMQDLVETMILNPFPYDIPVENQHDLASIESITYGRFFISTYARHLNLLLITNPS